MYEVKPYGDSYGIYKSGELQFVMHNIKYTNEVCDMLNYDERRYKETLEIDN